MIEPTYKRQKPLLNGNEQIFYKQLILAAGNDYLVVPQVHVEKLVAPKKWWGRLKYAVGHVSRWSVDFALYDKVTFAPLLAIELNGKSHYRAATIERDLDLKKHLDEAGIPLLTYYNDKPVSVEQLSQEIKAKLFVEDPRSL